MDIAASVKNLFKKRDFKDEIEKSLGVDRNFENVSSSHFLHFDVGIPSWTNFLQVLTEVFAVFAKSEFFNRADWEATIVKSIGNVNPFLQPDLQVRPSTDSGVYAVDKVDAEAPRYKMHICL